MASRTNRKADRHTTSQSRGFRIDNNLWELFSAKAELDGVSKNSLIVQWIENYVFGKNERK